MRCESHDHGKGGERKERRREEGLKRYDVWLWPGFAHLALSLFLSSSVWVVKHHVLNAPQDLHGTIRRERRRRTLKTEKENENESRRGGGETLAGIVMSGKRWVTKPGGASLPFSSPVSVSAVSLRFSVRDRFMTVLATFHCVIRDTDGHAQSREKRVR